MTEECIICLGDMMNPVKINRCQHNFCNRCLQKWIDTAVATGFNIQPSCPTCRQTIDRVDLTINSGATESKEQGQTIWPKLNQTGTTVRRKNDKKNSSDFTMPPRDFERKNPNR